MVVLSEFDEIKNEISTAIHDTITPYLQDFYDKEPRAIALLDLFLKLKRVIAEAKE